MTHTPQAPALSYCIISLQDTQIGGLLIYLTNQRSNIAARFSKLTDPSFPRRRGRVPGTLELVVHPNYVVILEQTLDTVTVLEVLHAAMKYP